MQPKFSYFEPGEVRWTGNPDKYAKWIVDVQLKNADYWRHFVEVYRTNADISDNGWRGEYWGKMMRGASLSYMYTKDESLYAVLKDAVEGLLDSQDSLGRFSTYDVEHEFHGWDVWSRKYVLTGMQHFYDICHDEALKKRIVAALCRHADYIISKLGNEPGKIQITETSNFWLGVNSASILEPFVRLYTMTSCDRYLDFAKYIVSTGGCAGESNLIDLALEDKISPYQYPETKAYETMSFFEGVLAYWEVTGEDKYIEAVKKFIEAVYRTDITIIGCAGCTHELFDNSAIKQTEKGETIMQETCVTVTWMRLLARMLTITGDARYAERISQSAWNALYGSLNLDMINQTELFSGAVLEGLPFDSYSPLYNDKRGRGIGGFKRFADGKYYGCCACIGAAGVALFPRTAAMRMADGFAINELLAGEINTKTPGGQPVKFEIKGNYPQSVDYTMKVSLAQPEKFKMSFRIPEFADRPGLTVDGTTVFCKPGYCEIEREWKDGDTVVIAFAVPLTEFNLNGKIAFKFGALVLARDSNKEGKIVDLTEKQTLVRGSNGLEWYKVKPEDREIARVRISRADGSFLVLSDYASCGRHWLDENSLMTVWMNV